MKHIYAMEKNPKPSTKINGSVLKFFCSLLCSSSQSSGKILLILILLLFFCHVDRLSLLGLVNSVSYQQQWMCVLEALCCKKKRMGKQFLLNFCRYCSFCKFTLTRSHKRSKVLRVTLKCSFQRKWRSRLANKLRNHFCGSGQSQALLRLRCSFC